MSVLRLAVVVVAVFALAACDVRRRDGDDFMDGRGVAAGLRHTLDHQNR